MAERLVESNKVLLSTGKYQDFVLRCEDRDFKVYWSIICTKSTVLEKLCSNNFRVSSSSNYEAGIQMKEYTLV
jgi:hypothetical protein